jgi:hypothetical protein
MRLGYQENIFLFTQRRAFILEGGMITVRDFKRLSTDYVDLHRLFLMIEN